jgi:hypothetical protein
MKPEKKFNLLAVLAAVFLSIFFAILIVGAIIPGDCVFVGAPWYIWAVIVDILAFIISVSVAFGIVVRKDKKAPKNTLE